MVSLIFCLRGGNTNKRAETPPALLPPQRLRAFFLHNEEIMHTETLANNSEKPRPLHIIFFPQSPAQIGLHIAIPVPVCRQNFHFFPPPVSPSKSCAVKHLPANLIQLTRRALRCCASFLHI